MHQIPKPKCFSSCLCPVHWSQVLSQEWRCSWSSADRHCSNYIWASVGTAPTTSEWSTILLPSKMWLILEVWGYICMHNQHLKCKLCMGNNTHFWLMNEYHSWIYWSLVSFCYHRLAKIRTWISNYTHILIWDVHQCCERGSRTQ